jgi:integrase
MPELKVNTAEKPSQNSSWVSALPADLSRHTQKSDPLKGKRDFDVTRHQESWRTAWRNLRETAAKAIENAAIEENRAREERKTIALFKALRFHTLRHTCITMMAERGIRFRLQWLWLVTCPLQ